MYYGYLERKRIVKCIIKTRKQYPNMSINLVGHSRGAAIAKEIAMIGGQYNSKLESHATLHKDLRIGHGKVIPLLLDKLNSTGYCAMDYLLAESQQPAT